MPDPDDRIADLERQLAELHGAIEDAASALGELAQPDITAADATTSEPSTSTVVLTRELHNACWVGRSDKLIRLETLLKEALENAKILIDDEHAPTWNKLTLKSEVTSAKGGIKRTGSIATILAEIDPGEIDAVSMTAGSLLSNEHHPRFELSLGKLRSYDDGGARFKISGPDRQWVFGTFEAIRTELNKARPWWSIFKKPLAQGFSFVILSVLAIAVTLHSIPKGSHSSWIDLVPLGSMIAVAVFVWATAKWAFPDLEVLESGGKARIFRLIAGIGALVGLTSGIVRLLA